MSQGNVLQTNNLFSVHAFGLTIPISDSIIMMWVIMAVLIILALVFTRDLQTIPGGRQNVAETIVGAINKLIKGNMGKHYKSFVPYFGTILLFLVFANVAGVFSILPTGTQLHQMTGIAFFEKLSRFSIVSPTKDLNVTLAMALMTICLIPISGIRYKGVSGWLKGFMKPTAVMLPFNILDYGTRTLSLSLRLFGNILAGYIIMGMLFESPIFVKLLIPLASGFFDLFDAGLQAYIFVFLSSIYISEVIE